MRFLLPSLMCAILIQFSATAQEYYKLYFSAEGIYRVTGQELAGAGIPISQIQPQTIQLFSDGQNILPYSTAEPPPQLQEVAIIVEDGGDGQLDPQDYLQFYGQALNRFEWDAAAGDFRFRSSPYDTLACYWLRWNVAPGKRIALKNGSPVSGGAILRDTFTDRLRLEEDRFNPIKSGLIWSWNLFGVQNTFAHSFELSGVAGAQATATARLLRLNVYYNSYPAGMMSVWVNNSLIGTRPGNNTFTAPAAIYEGANLLQVEYFPSDPADTLEVSGFDWLELVYPRYTRLTGEEMKLFIAPASGIFHTKYRSGGDPAAIFDISDPFNVRQIQTANDSLFEDTLTAEHKVYWFNRENFAHSLAGIQAGQRDIFSPAEGANYLIITRRQTEPLMQPLKAHREAYNNFAVKIVTVEDIFDEFGFGRQDPTAIRNFIKFAYENWNPWPQYILLAGNGYYDYRNLSGEYPVNWVPAFQISGNDDITSRAVDDFYVDLSFTDEPGLQPFPQPFGSDFILGLRESPAEIGHTGAPETTLQNFNIITPQIPIGRFPADTPEELAALVEKTIRSELNYEPGLWRLSALLIADDEFRGAGGGNEFFHLEQTEYLARQAFPSQLRTYKLYEREYPFVGNEKPAATRQLINWFNLGNRIAMFYGHGNDEQWTHENLLNVQRDMVSIRNDDKLCFFGGASSLYKFDDRHEGILQNLLKREKSGLTATLTANRPAFAFQSDIFFRSFFSRLFGDAGGFAGKAVMMAKISGIDNQKRHLLGDPALNLSLPAERVHVTAITPDTLKALSLAQISGYVDNPAAGDSLLIEVREPGKIISVPQLLHSYETTGGALFRGYVPLNNGQFTLQFVVSGDVPQDSAAARGKLHAYTWNGLNEGMGFVDFLPVGGSAGGTGDVIPPQINLTVTGGDTVGRDAYLVAQIFDESGVNLSRFQNHYPLLFIDGNYQDTLNLGDFFYYQAGSYQSGTLRYPLPYLSAGNHTLTLKVHDTYNNAAGDSISFVTGITPPPGYAPDQISLAQNYPNPFNPETVIPFTVSGSSGYRVRLEVFNLLGQRVRTLLNETVLPGEYEARWDGRDQRGNPVASGLYIYRLWVSSHIGPQRGGIYQHSRKMLLIR